MFALVPSGVVTRTSATPGACAGAVAVICVALFTVYPVAAVPPKVTLVAPVRKVPVITTDVPPAVVPVAGAMLVTQAMNAHLVDGAKVVNLSSGLGSIARTDSLYSPSYSISKAALNMATKLLSIALADRGIVVIAISPGWVRTDMGGDSATLAPEDSVASMLRIVDHLRKTDSGRFLSQTGDSIAW